MWYLHASMSSGYAGNMPPPSQIAGTGERFQNISDVCDTGQCSNAIHVSHGGTFG